MSSLIAPSRLSELVALHDATLMEAWGGGGGGGGEGRGGGEGGREGGRERGGEGGREGEGREGEGRERGRGEGGRGEGGREVYDHMFVFLSNSPLPSIRTSGPTGGHGGGGLGW